MQRVELIKLPSLWHILIIGLYRPYFVSFSIPIPLPHHSNVFDVHPFILCVTLYSS